MEASDDALAVALNNLVGIYNKSEKGQILQEIRDTAGTSVVRYVRDTRVRT